MGLGGVAVHLATEPPLPTTGNAAGPLFQRQYRRQSWPTLGLDDGAPTATAQALPSPPTLASPSQRPSQLHTLCAAELSALAETIESRERRSGDRAERGRRVEEVDWTPIVPRRKSSISSESSGGVTPPTKRRVSRIDGRIDVGDVAVTALVEAARAARMH